MNGIIFISIMFQSIIQQKIQQNNEHNIFKGKARSENIKRIDDVLYDEKESCSPSRFNRRIENSLRKIVNRNGKSPDELVTVTDKSRRLLLRGL